MRCTRLLMTQSGHADRPMIERSMRRQSYEQPIAMHAPLASSPTIQRHEKSRRALRPFSIAVVAAVLIMQAPNAHAQHKSATAGPTEEQKVRRRRSGPLRKIPTRPTSPRLVEFRTPNKKSILGAYAHGSSKIAVKLRHFPVPTRCPLLALSGHRLVHCTCLLLAQSGH